MERVDPTSELGRILVWCSGQKVTELRSNGNQLMQILMLIWRTIVNLAKQAWLLPKTIALALQQRRRLIERQEFEIERLDRIRNPSKYAGR
jgi:hypothetical protein